MILTPWTHFKDVYAASIWCLSVLNVVVWVIVVAIDNLAFLTSVEHADFEEKRE